MELTLRTERVPWESAPGELARATEAVLGSAVVHAETQRGGFSRRLACRLRCADGHRAFLKAVDTADDPVATGLIRREAAVAPELPDWLPAPAFVGLVEAAGWLGLLFEDVEGRLPQVPWRAASWEARDADDEAVDSVLALLAGRFVVAAQAPGPPAVRAFQRHEARAALDWLAWRRRW